MDLARFDHFGKRLAAWRVARSHAVQGLGATGLAAALLGVRREHAAAAISMCSGPCGPAGRCIPRFPIPGGPYGACRGISSCNPCHQTWEELDTLCNAAYALCRGECYASFPG